MKRKTFKKTCAGITATVSCVGFVGLTILAFLVLVVVQSCGAFVDDLTSSAYVQPTGVAFFESTGGWDYRRIALIQPYQAISTDKKIWLIDARTDPYDYRFSIEANRLNVIENRLIVAYCSDCLFEGDRVDELWFVIIPEEEIEKGFTKEEEFMSYVKDKGVDNPNLRDVEELYEELLNRGYLEWFPEAYRE